MISVGFDLIPTAGRPWRVSCASESGLSVARGMPFASEIYLLLPGVQGQKHFPVSASFSNSCLRYAGCLSAIFGVRVLNFITPFPTCLPLSFPVPPGGTLLRILEFSSAPDLSSPCLLLEKPTQTMHCVKSRRSREEECFEE